jgi:hydrogenase maturation protease
MQFHNGFMPFRPPCLEMKKNDNLVIGIGSPYISDDAIGIRVVESIMKMDLPNVDAEEASVSGLDMIEKMLDYKRVVVVDSIISGEREPGTVLVLTPDDFAHTVHGTNPHETNIATALELGRQLEPERFPKQVFFVAIEALNVVDISEEMTPPVKAALPVAVQTVLRLLS